MLEAHAVQRTGGTRPSDQCAKADSWSFAVHVVHAGPEGAFISTPLFDLEADRKRSWVISAACDSLEVANTRDHKMAWTEITRPKYERTGLHYASDTPSG